MSDLMDSANTSQIGIFIFLYVIYSHCLLDVGRRNSFKMWPVDTSSNIC